MSSVCGASIRVRSTTSNVLGSISTGPFGSVPLHMEFAMGRTEQCGAYPVADMDRQTIEAAGHIVEFVVVDLAGTDWHQHHAPRELMFRLADANLLTQRRRRR